MRSYGAKGDGTTPDTAAVTNAIRACARAGGGTVYFGPGRYVIGTVQLASHIRLLLESGAVLAGSHAIADYLPSASLGFAHHYGVDSSGEGEVLGMLVAANAEDISIEGKGEIDGQSDSFMDTQSSHYSADYDAASVRDAAQYDAAMRVLRYGPVEPVHRPGTMVIFFHCHNVQVQGVTLRNAPNWTLHMQDVDNAALSGFSILNDMRVPNNDGIDCMGCRRVRVSDCTISVGDDDFAIVGSENINVANCSLASRSAAIRLESTQLSTFTGLSMDTNRGIAIFASSHVGDPVRATDNVIFSNIAIRTHLIPGNWWGKAEPIYIAVQPCDVPGTACLPRVKNVVFSDIVAEAENGSLLWGGEGSPLTNITLRNVQLHMLAPDPAIAAGVGGNLDLRWTVTDRKQGMMKSEIPALYAKHVAGLTLSEVAVDWPAAMPAYFSDGVRVEQFSDLTVDRLQARQAPVATGAALALADGYGVSVTNSRALPATRVFLEMDNVRDRRVFVNYDLGGAAQAIAPADQHFDVEAGIPTAKPPRGSSLRSP